MGKILTLVLPFFIIITLALCGVVYSHWSERVRIISRVKMGDLCVRIGSYKILVENEEEVNLAYGTSIKIWVRGEEEGGIWIGLVIANEGSLPAFVKYSVTLPEEFSYESYFYGPYKRGIPREVWAFWSGSIVEGYRNKPPNLNIGYKFVAWHHITWNCYVNGTRQYEGQIIYSAWFTSWSMTNKVSIYFELSGNHTKE